MGWRIGKKLCLFTRWQGVRGAASASFPLLRVSNCCSRFPFKRCISTNAIQDVPTSSPITASIVRILRSEKEYQLELSPPSQPWNSYESFEVDGRPGEMRISLRKTFHEIEEIELEATMFDGLRTVASHGKEDMQFHITLLVRFSRNQRVDGRSLEFVCSAWPDRLEIHHVYFVDGNQLCAAPYLGPDVRKLRWELRNQLAKFLAHRGIDDQLCSFLHSYMLNKDKIELIQWLGKGMASTSSSELKFSSSTSTVSDPSATQRSRILSSKLYFDVPLSRVSVIYSPSYDIAFFGIEKLHPFDSSKWGRVCTFLVDSHVLERSNIIEPHEASEDDLLVVHSEAYLSSLRSSLTVASIIEVPLTACLPFFLLQRKVLQPFRKQVGGTILAAKVAKERGWAINIGGGFHHCSSELGGGFCVYADISLCIHFAFVRLNISRVMIVDLDAHQGNGHERDFSNDKRVFILDMYNPLIYPLDNEARAYIDLDVKVMTGTSTTDYLSKLDEALEVSSQKFDPELIVYNAGTDILDGDPLGRLKVSPDGVTLRDEKVFAFARQRKVPIVMLTSGGYTKASARVVADSIINLSKKSLIS